MVETKEDNDENLKPTKHKKTGRSKKEKPSSVPLLPSPCPSSDLSRFQSNFTFFVLLYDTCYCFLLNDCGMVFVIR